MSFYSCYWYFGEKDGTKERQQQETKDGARGILIM